VLKRHFRSMKASAPIGSRVAAFRMEGNSVRKPLRRFHYFRQVLFALALILSPVSASSQGKVNLVNDSASLVVLSATGALFPADLGLAGQAVGNSSPLPSGITLVAGLYAGINQNALFLYSTVALNNAGLPAGRIPAQPVILNAQANGAPAIPGIPGGTPIGANTPWFQVKIWDAAYPSFEAASDRKSVV
jgi:hypothetical protein